MQGKRCRGIEEVLSKRLLHFQPKQMEEGWEGGERREGEGCDKVGSSISRHNIDEFKGESNSVARCVAEVKNATKVVLAQSSSLASGISSNTSIVPDSDSATQLVTNSNKPVPSPPSNPDTDERRSSQPEDGVTSESGRRACHQTCNNSTITSLSSTVMPQHIDRGSGTNMPTTSITSAPPSSATPSVKISPPKQVLSRTRVLSPLVTHSHRTAVTPTPPCQTAKGDQSPNPKRAKQIDAAECSTESLFSPSHAPLPLTSFPSPFMYTALQHPWTPSMEWQYPSLLSMMLASSPSQPVKRQSENTPPDSAFPEQPPKWMWADPFGGLSGNNGGAPALPSSLFSPPQLFSQPMSPFSPSQLLNLSLPTVDSFPAIAPPPVVPTSGSDGRGGGGEGGSLEESPFKGMQRTGKKEEQKPLSGVSLSGARGEVEGAHASKRLRRGSVNADEVSVQEISVYVCVHMCMCPYTHLHVHLECMISI